MLACDASYCIELEVHLLESIYVCCVMCILHIEVKNISSFKLDAEDEVQILTQEEDYKEKRKK